MSIGNHFTRKEKFSKMVKGCNSHIPLDRQRVTSAQHVLPVMIWRMLKVLGRTEYWSPTHAVAVGHGCEHNGDGEKEELRGIRTHRLWWGMVL